MSGFIRLAGSLERRLHERAWQLNRVGAENEEAEKRDQEHTRLYPFARGLDRPHGGVPFRWQRARASRGSKRRIICLEKSNWSLIRHSRISHHGRGAFPFDASVFRNVPAHCMCELRPSRIRACDLARGICVPPSAANGTGVRVVDRCRCFTVGCIGRSDSSSHATGRYSQGGTAVPASGDWATRLHTAMGKTPPGVRLAGRSQSTCARPCNGGIDRLIRSHRPGPGRVSQRVGRRSAAIARHNRDMGVRREEDDAN